MSRSVLRTVIYVGAGVLAGIAMGGLGAVVLLEWFSARPSASWRRARGFRALTPQEQEQANKSVQDPKTAHNQPPPPSSFSASDSSASSSTTSSDQSPRLPPYSATSSSPFPLSSSPSCPAPPYPPSGSVARTAIPPLPLASLQRSTSSGTPRTTLHFPQLPFSVTKLRDYAEASQGAVLDLHSFQLHISDAFSQILGLFRTGYEREELLVPNIVLVQGTAPRRIAAEQSQVVLLEGYHTSLPNVCFKLHGQVFVFGTDVSFVSLDHENPFPPELAGKPWSTRDEYLVYVERYVRRYRDHAHTLLVWFEPKFFTLSSDDDRADKPAKEIEVCGYTVRKKFRDFVDGHMKKLKTTDPVLFSHVEMNMALDGWVNPETVGLAFQSKRCWYMLMLAFHPRIGQHSTWRRVVKDSPIYDPKALLVLRSFLDAELTKFSDDFHMR